MSYRILLLAVLLPTLLLAAGCASRPKPPRHARAIERTMTVTGYCACKQCCNWKRNWFGRPVVAGGSAKGKHKKIGVTAAGTKAKPGTIAADTSVYGFGTVMYVPGYGYGRVEDRGSAIKDQKIDVFFKKHKDALRWGRQTQKVTIWPQ